MQCPFLSKPSILYVKNYGSSLIKLHVQRCPVALSVSKIHTPAESIDHSRNTRQKQWTDTHISNVLPHFWNGTGRSRQYNKFISFSQMPLNHACRVYSTKSGNNNYDDGDDYKKKYFDLLNATKRKNTEYAEEKRQIYRALIGPEVYDLMDPSEGERIARELIRKQLCEQFGLPYNENHRSTRNATKEAEDATNEADDATERERTELIKEIRKVNRVLIGPEVYDLMDPSESDEIAHKLVHKRLSDYEATNGCTE